MTGFVTADVTVAGGTKSNFSGNGSSYTLVVTPDGSADVVVEVAADAATDGLNTGPASAQSATATWDATAPTVDIGGVPSKINSTDDMTATFEFSEDVTGFVTADVTVTGGTKGAFTGSGSSYTLAVTPDGSADVVVEVAADAATDGLNTGPESAVSATATWDATAPTVEIAGVPSKINSRAALGVTFTFSEDVTGFVTGDVTVTGGTKSNFSGNGSSYTLVVTPDGSEDVVVEVAANSATDGLNTGPASAQSATATWDATAPTVEISGVPSKINSRAVLSVTFEFSEDVTGFVTADVRVTGGTKGQFSGGGTTYTLPVTPTGSADVVVEVAANAATDGLNTGPASAQSATATWDAAAPTVEIGGVPSKINSMAALSVTFEFSEDVTGFVTADVTVTGGTKSNFSGNGSSYTLVVTPDGSEDLVVEVAANSATDGLNTGPESAVSETATWDAMAPTVEIGGVPSKINSRAALSVTFTFSEDVTGFAAGGVTVAGGTKGMFTAVNASSYTLAVTPSGSTDVVVTVVANSATDGVNSGPANAVSATATWDAAAPSVTIGGVPAKINSRAALGVTFTFSEDVTGFVTGDVTVTGGTKGMFTAVNASSYTLAVTPSGSEDVVVEVAANSVTDGTNTGPASAVSETATWDATAPSVEIGGVPAKINSTAALNVTFEFSEAVTGFVTGDVTVTGGTRGAFSGSGTTYTLPVTPANGSNVTVEVAANSATDGLNTGPAGAVSATATWDATRPTVQVTGVPAKINTAAAFTATFEFSEAVTDFVTADVTVAGGTKSTFTAVSVTEYTLAVTPDGSEDVVVTVAADAATDGLNTGPASAVSATATWDATRPTVEIAGVPGKINSTDDFTATFEFSEDVTGFATADVTVAGGTKSNFSGNGTTYTLVVTPDGSEDVVVTVAADAATDGLNTGPASAVSATATWDATAPTVEIGGVPSKINSTSPLTVTFTFSEAVTDFVTGDVTVTGGTKGNFSGGGTTYTLPVTPASGSNVTVEVAANSATDGVNTGPPSAVSATATWDAAAPSVAITGVPARINTRAAFTATFEFSEDVTGFVTGDVRVTGGTKGNFSGGGTTYTLPVTPDGSEDVVVEVAANSATDGGGNTGPASAESATATWDAAAPTVVIGGVPSKINTTSPLTVTFEFSEAVTDFVAGDVTVAGGTKGMFTTVSATEYTLVVTPSDSADVTVEVAANAATDGLNTGPASAESATATWDATAPTVEIGGVPSKINTTSPLTVTFTFSEAVTGFVTGDVTVTGGTKGAFTGSGSSYTLPVTPDGSEDVVVEVAANAATDGLNTGPASAVSATATWDAAAPSVAITGVPSRINTTAAFTATFEFSEAVTGFATADVTVTGGTKGNFSGGGTTYTLPVTPDGSEDVVLTVSANAATDGGGNTGPASAESATATWDAAAPTVVIGGVPSKINSTSPLTVTFTFSEAVTDFVTGDVTVTGGTKGQFSGGGTTYTLPVTPDGSEDVVVEVAANSATDGLNTGPASAQSATAAWDATAPTVEIGGVPAKINSTSPLTVTFTFSEAVTDFVTGDVTVTGGTKGNFSGGGTTYTLAVTPTTGSNVTVEVAANSATDGVNTGPANAVSATATWDATAPSVAITGVPARINSTAAFTATFEFSEAVTGFVTGDVTVTGGTKGNFSGGGTTYTLPVTPDGSEDVVVRVAANAATDGGGTTGPASAVSATAAWDATAPTVAITGVPARINSTFVLTATFEFSEAVTGFVTGDVTVAGGTKGAFTVVSATEYTLAVTPSGSTDVTVEVAANSATDGLNTGPPSAVSATATWQAAVAAVTVGDASATEGDAMTFTVTLDRAVPGGLTVTPRFTDGTATGGVDYTANTAALAFAGTAGETRSFTVATIEDALVEGDETFTVGLTVSGTTETVTATDTGTGTIRDDDTAPARAVSLSAAPNPVNEGGSVTVTARLSGTLADGVTIPLTLTAGTAESGDYGALAGIAVAAGATEGTGTVATVNDADRDDETFTVALGALPDGLAAGSPSSVVVTIRDRTPPPNRSPTVTVSCDPCVVAPGGSVQLTATASDEDGDPLTYGWSATWGAFDGPVDEPEATWTAPGRPGSATILVEVSDGRGGFASAEVEVHAVNDPPYFERSSYRFELPEHLDGRARPVELGRVVATDPDGDELKYGIVLGDSERFEVGVRDGTVWYVGPGEDFETEPNRFELTVRVRDDFGADDAVPVVVEVTDVNERPEVTASCEPCAVPRGGEVRLEATASDPDGDPLTYAWSAPRGGFSDADERVAFWAAPAEPGTTTIRVEVSDGRGGTASASVVVEVVNSAPAFGQPSYGFELPENVDGRERPAALGPVAATDPDGDELTYDITGGDRERFAVGERDGMVWYVGPGEDFETEPHLFELAVRVRDGFGAEDEARVVVEVTDVNELPEVTASCDPCAVPRGGEALLTATASDPDGDPLTYAWSAPIGRFTGADEPVARWRAPAELGPVAIRVVVSDGRGGSASAVVDIEVVNRAPAFAQPSYAFELPENVDGRERPAELGPVVATDPDADALTYEIVSGDFRFAVGERDGVVRYVGPGEDFETPPNLYELTVRALDGFGGEARTEVVVEVTDVNERPEAADDEAVTPEDEAVTIDVLANDTDPEGDRLRVRSVTAAAHGAVRLLSGGHVFYAPEADFHGTDSFAYVASDGRGLTDTATVAVTVLPVNDAPTAVGTIPDQTLDEGGAAVEVDLSPFFGDVDGDALTYGARSNDTGVVLASVAGSVLVLTPAGYGSATVAVTAWDPAGLTAVQSVRVGVSDRPQRAILGNVLAATARGHLASLRAALGRRMEAGPCEASRLAVMGRSVPLGRTGAEAMLRERWTGARSTVEGALGLGGGAEAPFGAMRLTAGRGEPTALAAGTSPERADRIGDALRSVPARTLGVGGGTGSGAGAADFLLGWGGSDEDGGRCPASGRWSLWGQGDVQRFEGTPSAHGHDSAYDGELQTAYVGLDTRLGARWLAGVAVSRSKGVGDWRAGTSEGRLTQFMTAVHPYLRWDGGSTSVWASAGQGAGDARNLRAAGRLGTSPTSLRLGLVALEQRLGAPGGLDVAFKGDAAWARLRTGDGDETIDRQDIAVNQVRIGTDLSLSARLGGAELTPFGTVYARRDGGAGQTGDGVEIAGGLRAVLGFVRLDAQARMLAHHTAEGYGERGAAVTLALGKHGNEEGFSLSVSPRWGGPARATGELLRGPLGGRLRPGGPEPGRWTLDARASYGVLLPGGLKLDAQGGYGGASGGLSLGLSVGIRGVQGGRSAPPPVRKR